MVTTSACERTPKTETLNLYEKSTPSCIARPFHRRNGDLWGRLESVRPDGKEKMTRAFTNLTCTSYEPEDVRRVPWRTGLGPNMTRIGESTLHPTFPIKDIAYGLASKLDQANRQFKGGHVLVARKL